MTDPCHSPPQVPARLLSLGDSRVTTALELPACRGVRNLDIVRGISVRSRPVLGKFIGGPQTLFGGNITIYPERCEQARM
jgi:uncharacterized protein YbjQ (UPF0145 family)